MLRLSLTFQLSSSKKWAHIISKNHLRHIKQKLILTNSDGSATGLRGNAAYH